VRRHRRAGEPGGGEDEGQQRHGQSRTGTSVCLRLLCRGRSRLYANRNQQPVQWQPEQQMRCGPCEACGAPAELGVQPAADRPAHRTGEAGEQGDAGDRAARIASVDAGKRGEGRLVKAERHADSDHQPAEPEHQRPVCQAEHGQAEGKNDAGKRQHITPAVMVDALARQRPKDGGDDQCQGKRGEYIAGGDAQFARHRLGENGR